MMSDKMDDERLEMNEKMMKMESKAAEVERNLRQQVRLIQFNSVLLYPSHYSRIITELRHSKKYETLFQLIHIS